MGLAWEVAPPESGWSVMVIQLLRRTAGACPLTRMVGQSANYPETGIWETLQSSRSSPKEGSGIGALSRQFLSESELTDGRKTVGWSK